MSGHRPVLVVEDDPEIRRLICETLEDAGYRTAVAPDGPSAIASLVADEPLAVVLDLGLPFIDGTHVARISRRLYDGVPIVVVSANGHVAADAREIGASAFLAKPFDLDDLARAVRRAVAGREALSAGRREALDRPGAGPWARRDPNPHALSSNGS